MTIKLDSPSAGQYVVNESKGDTATHALNPNQLVIQIQGLTRARRDFNGDARSDSLWRNANGAVGVWSSNSGGVVFSTLGAADTSWRIQKT